MLAATIKATVFAVSLSLGWTNVLTAETTAVFVNRDALFTSSRLAASMLQPIRQQESDLFVENAKLIAELEDLELELTRVRDETQKDKFDQMAAEFDQRVKSIRSAQDAKEDELEQKKIAIRAAFFERIRPIVMQIMMEQGAEVLIDDRSILMTAPEIDVLAFTASNITTQVVTRIDQELREQE